MARFLATRGPAPRYWRLTLASEVICWECLADERSGLAVWSPASHAKRCHRCGYSHLLVSQEVAVAAATA